MTVLESRWTGRDVADPAFVASLADEVRDVVARKGLEAVLAVGQLLLDRCFDADPSQFGPSATIDALALLPDAPLGRTSMYRAVRVLLQWRELPADVRDDLSASQHAALLLLPADHTGKIPLAREAALSRMPVRELTDRARALLGRAPLAVESAAREEGLQSLTKATRVLEPWSAAIKAGRKPTPAEARRVREEVARLRSLLADLEAWAG